MSETETRAERKLEKERERGRGGRKRQGIAYLPVYKPATPSHEGCSSIRYL